MEFSKRQVLFVFFGPPKLAKFQPLYDPPYRHLLIEYSVVLFIYILPVLTRRVYLELNAFYFFAVHSMCSYMGV